MSQGFSIPKTRDSVRYKNKIMGSIDLETVSFDKSKYLLFII